MHNFFATSSVLADPLQVLPAKPRLHNVCPNVTTPGVFVLPSFS